MRIVFIGASSFGQKCLNHLIKQSGLDVVGVVSAKSQFSISYAENFVNNVNHADLSILCKNNNIPVMLIDDNGMKTEGLFESVRSFRPDAFIVAGWYHMIPRSWRNVAPAFGLHASLLPDYSGGAPLVWALINGESETGISFFKFDGGVDSGPIVGQKKIMIVSFYFDWVQMYPFEIQLHD